MRVSFIFVLISLLTISGCISSKQREYDRKVWLCEQFAGIPYNIELDGEEDVLCIDTENDHVVYYELIPEYKYRKEY